MNATHQELAQPLNLTDHQHDAYEKGVEHGKEQGPRPHARLFYENPAQHWAYQLGLQIGAALISRPT